MQKNLHRLDQLGIIPVIASIGVIKSPIPLEAITKYRATYIVIGSSHLGASILMGQNNGSHHDMNVVQQCPIESLSTYNGIRIIWRGILWDQDRLCKSLQYIITYKVSNIVHCDTTHFTAVCCYIFHLDDRDLRRSVSLIFSSYK